jgi:quinol monooxygenase YgiN
MRESEHRVIESSKNRGLIHQFIEPLIHFETTVQSRQRRGGGSVMFMRLVQVKVKAENAGTLADLYAKHIVPTLQQTRGCIYASLIQSTSNKDESISLTLWESPHDAELYEQSGAFQHLLSEAQPYLAESSEWKIQLSKDLTLEYTPVSEEPVVRSYTVTTPSTERPPVEEKGHLYIRILSIKLQPGKVEEFANLYQKDILPILRSVEGCRYAFLTEGVEERNEVISLTVWNSKEAADTYENSGLFRKLTRKVQHTFSELYQWKMAAERRSSVQVMTTEDLNVRGYRVVSGKTFH